MRKFRIRAIFIDPTNGEAPASKPTRRDLRDQCAQVLSDSFARLRQEFARKQVLLDTEAIHAAANNLLDALSKMKKPLVTLSKIDAGGDRLLQHSVNVAVLGLVLARDLRVPDEQLYDLAVALLFHDVGMVILPENLLYGTRRPTVDEIKLIARHARLGFEHLVHGEQISAAACGLILRHHERLDGTGYPQGLHGEHLSQQARILAVAECYDSLTSARLGLDAALPDAALSFILARAGTHFAPDVAVALCRRVALYPVGTAVQLNTGEYCEVVGLLPDMPHRPTLLARTDSRGTRLPQPVIVDLSSETERGIARAAPTMERLLQSRQPDYVPAQINPLYANIG